MSFLYQIVLNLSNFDNIYSHLLLLEKIHNLRYGLDFSLVKLLYKLFIESVQGKRTIHVPLSKRKVRL